MRVIATYTLLILICINTIYVALGANFYPLQSMDAIGIWLFKAKAIYLEQGFPLSFLQTEQYVYSHPRYPLGLPYIFSLLYWIVGGVQEKMILALYPFVYVFILVLVYKTLSLKTNHVISLLGVYIYSSFPVFIALGGRILAGNADIFLVAIEWIIVYLLYKNKSEKIPYYFIVFLIIVASQIKLEGVFLATMILFFRIQKQQKMALLLVSVLPSVFWLMTTLFLHIPSDTQTEFIVPSPSQVYERGGIIVLEVLKELFNINNWYIFWPLLFLLLFVHGKLSEVLRRILIPTFLTILFLMIVIYFFSSNNTADFVGSSFDRVLFQHSAIFFMLLFEKIFSLLLYIKRNFPSISINM